MCETIRSYTDVCRIDSTNAMWEAKTPKAIHICIKLIKQSIRPWKHI